MSDACNYCLLIRLQQLSTEGLSSSAYDLYKSLLHALFSGATVVVSDCDAVRCELLLQQWQVHISLPVCDRARFFIAQRCERHHNEAAVVSMHIPEHCMCMRMQVHIVRKYSVCAACNLHRLQQSMSPAAADTTGHPPAGGCNNCSCCQQAFAVASKEVPPVTGLQAHKQRDQGQAGWQVGRSLHGSCSCGRST